MSAEAAALRRAMELANDADLRLTAPRMPTATGTAPITLAPIGNLDQRLPMPGTCSRAVQGQTLCVQVLADGFLFEGERFKSLSAVARRITGSAWNGFLFFGLTKKAVEA